MITDNIELLAKQDGVLALPMLEKKLFELQAMGWRILECIIYVRYNQNFSLNEAKRIVVNSAAWNEEKEEFQRHQGEMQEEFFEALIEGEMKKYNRLYTIPK
ncbi:MAG: hypothetical protein EOP48_12075 [Sphingobacteriales bacterium]|nr:MAG: hypothetical protein EOP48_12075 [Sphingobacteriales bacterium]